MREFQVGDLVTWVYESRVMEVDRIVSSDDASKNNSTVGHILCKWGSPGSGFSRRAFPPGELEFVD